LLGMLEDMRSDQLSALLDIAQNKGRPIGELVVEAMAVYLACMLEEERSQALEILKEGGVDWDAVT
jgi:hypothetical protein